MSPEVSESRIDLSGESALSTHLAEPDVIDYSDRVFHLEMLKGGMNRLPFRSNRGSNSSTRVEILFMNVKYLALGTTLDGMTVRDICAAGTDLGWRIGGPDDVHVYRVESSSGEGLVVAGSVTVDRSEAGPADPSLFFMMD
jgi:hypothetical protein